MTITIASRDASSNSRADIVGADGDDIQRHVLRKLIRPAVDPADRERQWRKREHDGSADVTGAEQQDRRGHFAEAFVE